MTQLPYQSITQMLASNAKTYPDDVALRQKKHGIWQETTWQEYFNITQAIAAGLQTVGAQPKNHIGIIAENCQEWLLAQLATNFLGAVACGLYPTSPANEVKHLMLAADCSIIFCEDQEQVDKILAIEAELPLLQKIIVFNDKGLNNYQHTKLIRFTELIQQGQRALQDSPLFVESHHRQQQPDDTALIVFTSGSTGLPKAAMISFANMWHEMQVISDIIKAEPGQNILSYLPLCHIAEQAVSNLNAIKNRIVINFGESLRTIRTDLQEISPQLFFGVPRIWEKMQTEILVLTSRCGPIRRWFIARSLHRAQRFGAILPINFSTPQRVEYWMWNLFIYRHLRSYLGLAQCHYAMTAAAPISPALLGLMRGIGIRLCEIFGMTETSGAATVQPWHMNSQGRIGKPAFGVECKLADDGELMVKGGIIFKGYYKNPTATKETLDNGWLLTGDIATQHEDGSFSIIDRKKDIMINAAGKNLSPSLIENTMKASPYIKECICIADQRPYVAALIQIDADAIATWAENNGLTFTTFKSLSLMPEVIDFISAEVNRENGNLARVEQIKRFYLLPKELDHDDGEVTATMKVRRKNIAAQFAGEIETLFAS